MAYSYNGTGGIDENWKKTMHDKTAFDRHQRHDAEWKMSVTKWLHTVWFYLYDMIRWQYSDREQTATCHR